jgi:metalloendopeptidase OMA1, mitochondrial
VFLIYTLQIEKYIQAQTLQEFQGKILPPDHRLTVHVKRVVDRILTANNLGTITDERPPTTPRIRTQIEDMWDPDASMHSFEQEPVSELEKPPSQRQWKVIVINDPSFVNAFAIPGT